MQIYKILTTQQWTELQKAGHFAGAPIDVTDGYVHFSTAKQAHETAARHFAGQDGLWLLAFATEGLGESLKWEPSRGGDLFPHFYGELHMSNVLWAKQLPLGTDGHLFPGQLA